MRVRSRIKHRLGSKDKKTDSEWRGTGRSYGWKDKSLTQLGSARQWSNK